MAPRRFQHRRHITSRQASHYRVELFGPRINCRTIDRREQIRDTFMPDQSQHCRRRKVEPLGNQQARLYVERLPCPVYEFIQRRMAYSNLLRRLTNRKHSPPPVYQLPQCVRIHTYIGGL